MRGCGKSENMRDAAKSGLCVSPILTWMQSLSKLLCSFENFSHLSFQKTSRKKNQFIKGLPETKILNFRPSRSTSHVSRCPPSIWLALRSHTESVKVVFQNIFILYFRFFWKSFFSTSRACPRTPCSSAHQTLLTLSLSHRCPDSLSHKVPFYHKLIFTL